MIDPIVEPAAGSTFAAMRHRNFQLYFGGQLISNIGTWTMSRKYGVEHTMM